jgi:hypothetical protein
VHYGGRVVAVRLSVSGGHAARMVVGGQDLRVLYDVTDTHIRVEVEGRVHQFGRQMAGQVRANAPSMVVSLNVKVGDKIKSDEDGDRFRRACRGHRDRNSGPQRSASGGR